MSKQGSVFTTTKGGKAYFASEVDEYVGMLREAYEELWNETEELRQEVEKEKNNSIAAMTKSQEGLLSDKETLSRLENDALEAKNMAQGYLNELTQLKETMAINDPEGIKASYESRIGELTNAIDNLTKEITQLQEQNQELIKKEEELKSHHEQTKRDFDEQQEAYKKSHEQEKVLLIEQFKYAHEQEKEELKQQLASACEEEKESLKQQLTNKNEQEKEELKQQLASAHEVEKASLKQQLVAVHEEEKASIKTKLKDAYEKEVVKFNDDIGGLKEELESLKEKNAGLLKDKEELVSGFVNDQQVLVAQRDLDRQSHEQEKEDLKNKLKEEHEQEKENLKSRLEAAHEQEKETLKNKLEYAHSQEQKGFKSQLEETYEQEKKALKNQLADSHGKELEKVIGQVDELRRDVARLQEKNQGLLAEKEVLATRLNDAKENPKVVMPAGSADEYISLIGRARMMADSYVDDAKTKMEALLNNAQKETDSKVKSARAEAFRIVREAKVESDNILKQANEKKAEIGKKAKEEYEQIRGLIERSSQEYNKLTANITKLNDKEDFL